MRKSRRATESRRLQVCEERQPDVHEVDDSQTDSQQLVKVGTNGSEGLCPPYQGEQHVDKGIAISLVSPGALAHSVGPSNWSTNENTLIFTRFLLGVS